MMRKVLLMMGATLLLASCSMKTYYQVYQTKPVDEAGYTTSADNVVFSDANVEVRYDFFDEKGDAGFVMQNNTDQVLYLHLDECFFILNGVANDYFQERSWGETTAKTTTHSFQRHEGDKNRKTRKEKAAYMQDASTTVEGSSATESKALTHQERPVVVIPPHAAKRIAEYSICQQMLSFCGVKETPSGSKTAGQSFTMENSPIVFGNFLTYTLGQSMEKQTIRNDFYVSEVINAGEKAMIYEVHRKDICGKDMGGKENLVKVFNHNTPDKFYVTYSR